MYKRKEKVCTPPWVLNIFSYSFGYAQDKDATNAHLLGAEPNLPKIVIIMFFRVKNNYVERC